MVVTGVRAARRSDRIRPCMTRTYGRPIGRSMEKRLNFAEFTLDLKNDELLREGKPVPLQPQPMKVLTLLARRAGELVTREELCAAVWGSETHVDFDQGLNWCIRRIREVLGDDVRQPRFVQTIPRKGYRFLIVPAAKRPRRWLAAPAGRPEERRVGEEGRA